MTIELDYLEMEKDVIHSNVGTYKFTTIYEQRPEEAFEDDLTGLIAEHPEWNASVEHYESASGLYWARTTSEGARVRFEGEREDMEDLVLAIKEKGYGTPDKLHYGSILHPIDSTKDYLEARKVVKEHRVTPEFEVVSERNNGHKVERVATWESE